MVKNFTSNKQIGTKGEVLARNYLENLGYKILDTNFHYSKMAEIDIIAIKDNVIHFVEVKTRTSNTFGTPFEAIDIRKVKSIYKCAIFYLQQNKNYIKMKFQIDAIGIILKSDTDADISIIENLSF